jgi:hypothetical protein
MMKTPPCREVFAFFRQGNGGGLLHDGTVAQDQV